LTQKFYFSIKSETENYEYLKTITKNIAEKVTQIFLQKSEGIWSFPFLFLLIVFIKDFGLKVFKVNFFSIFVQCF
jgi:hypothetical protein